MKIKKIYDTVHKEEEKEITVRLVIDEMDGVEVRVVDDCDNFKQTLLRLDENGVCLPFLTEEYQKIFKCDKAGRLSVSDGY